MRITQLRHQAIVPPVFVSSKCKLAIPIRNVLFLHALQQASLDSSVRTIRSWEALDVHGLQVPLTGAVIDRMDGNFFLMVCETRPKRREEESMRLAEVLKFNGLRLFERDAVDIKREPLFSNVRAVWSHERYHVPLKDRLKIAATLTEDGPQSILELEDRARPACDILAAVCALACEDRVELNIQDTCLGPHTNVRGL